MPVVDVNPGSEDYERSPSPETERDHTGHGPAKKARLTVVDIQRRQLDKLLANPDKEVKLPAGMAERIGGVRAPKEIIKSVAGSASAAGSGEFHVYKQSRRREAERIRHMEETNRALEEQQAFQQRQAERDAAADAKTAKNRAKRQKRKAGRKGDDKGAGAGPSKFGGSAVAFRRPGEESDDEESAPAPAAAPASKFAAPDGGGAAPTQQTSQEGAASGEVKISIVDED